MPRLPDGEELQDLSIHAVVTTIIVTAGVIERDGRFLITRRQKGVHLEGFWEFPGGKCDAGETLDACLVRELREELAVGARVGSEIFRTTHDYADRRVELHFLKCELLDDPSPQIGQEMMWAPRAQLKHLPFPPADAELIAMLARIESDREP